MRKIAAATACWSSLALSVGCAARAPAPPAAPVFARTPAPAPATVEPGGQRYPWVADQGDGTYRNPILFGDYSDPDVIRAGDRYYLIASSFGSAPGLPILVSHDLVSWTIAGHALAAVPDPRYARVQPGAGIWAPALREHAGTFYIFAPTPDEGIYVLTAPAPEGPWSAPRLLLPGRGLIDPCPFWDHDGRAYLVHAYARSRSGIKHKLRVRPMAPDASAMLGEGRIVFDDPARHPTLEGPKLYARGGWYYILAPAGGVERGWQVALRARGVYGPYEDRVVLQQGRTPVNGPHQGALVDTPAGEWWFVHFQQLDPYGRIVHLQPVAWQDGWPVMGAGGEPVLRFRKPAGPAYPAAAPQTSDDFDASGGDDNDGLAPQWQWNANPEPGWASRAARPGWLRLAARPLPGGDLAQAPHLLLQKLPARAFTVETVVDPAGLGAGASAGLVVLGRTHAALAVAPSTRDAGGGAQITLWVDGHPVFTREIARGPVRLGVAMADGGLCRFTFAGAGAAAAAGAPATAVPVPFQATPGVWVGARVGLFAAAPERDAVAGADGARAAGSASGAGNANAAIAASPHADFDFFRFGPP